MLANREMGGVVGGSGVFLFKRMWLDAFVNRPRWQPEHPVHCLFMAVDPCGGGSASDWAVCTLAFEDAKVVVCVNSSSYM